MSQGQKRPEFGRRNVPKSAAPAAVGPAAGASRAKKKPEGVKKPVMYGAVALALGATALIGLSLLPASEQPVPPRAAMAPPSVQGPVPAPAPVVVAQPAPAQQHVSPPVAAPSPPQPMATHPSASPGEPSTRRN